MAKTNYNSPTKRSPLHQCNNFQKAASQHSKDCYNQLKEIFSKIDNESVEHKKIGIRLMRNSCEQNYGQLQNILDVYLYGEAQSDTDPVKLEEFKKNQEEINCKAKFITKSNKPRY